jgi:glutamyl-Q tRNA(Asp) synthetase
MTSPVYRGRFAPSPTGPLHFGSLVAAVASHADARHHEGIWLVRVDDVDQTRSRPDAERQILDRLQIFGMHPDQAPVRQSERTDRYLAELDRLIRRGSAYRCTCSRKTVAAVARVGIEGPVYPGTCRLQPPEPGIPAAWRVSVTNEPVEFDDRILGRISQNLGRDIGDFVIRRIDGFTAYQLAVVVDDFDQGISDVVRGADLLWSTPRQIWLQRLLGYSGPRYAHIPLVYGQDGHKLSKSDNAHPVDEQNPVRSLSAAWLHLGQEKPPQNLGSSEAFWGWAVPHWVPERVPHDRNERHERTDAL